MTFDIDFEQKEDGRWLAEIAEIPGTCLWCNAVTGRG